MQANQLHAHESTVDGIPADEADLQNASNESRSRLALSHETYSHLLNPHLHQQELTYQPSHTYYSHVTQQYQPNHNSQSHSSYLAPLGSQLQHSYIANQEADNVSEVDKSTDLDALDDASAAAHLAALRNTVRADSHQPAGMDSSHIGHQIIGLDGLNGQSYMYENIPHADLGRYDHMRKRTWTEAALGPEMGDILLDPSRIKRKQNRRPDRLCHFENCLVTPTYNYPGEKKRIYCVSHKKDGMVNVVAKRCGHPGCSVNPRFNYEGQNRGLYCSEHKLEGMVNVIDRRCEEPNCKKFPSHNYPGAHKKLFCATHKKEGMVDMSHGPGLVM